MYQYLRAIGLEKYNTKKKIKELTELVRRDATRKDSYQLNNEEELIKMQLDIPFSLKFVNEMKKQGIVLKREIQMEKVVDELCRLRFEN